MYNLHERIPYEGENIAVSGSLEEIKAWIKANPHTYADDCYLTQDCDVCIYEFFKEALA